MIIRTRVEDIRLCGRYTMGVRIMRLAEGSRIVGVARAEKEEEALTETEVPVENLEAQDDPETQAEENNEEI